MIDEKLPATGYESMANGAVLGFPFGTAGNPIPRIPKRLRLSGLVRENDKPDIPVPGIGLEPPRPKAKRPRKAKAA